MTLQEDIFNDDMTPQVDVMGQLSDSKLDDTDGTECVTSETATTRSSITPADSTAETDMEEEEIDKPGDLEATLDMCFHCFDVLLLELMSFTPTKSSKNGVLSHLFGSSKNKSSTSSSWDPVDFVSELADPRASCPLFVTWDKQTHHSRYELRGCIGTLSPRPLSSAVGEYALTSALHDRRFQPIRLSEISHLRVAVSLLVNYEDMGSDVYNWSVGTHGIVLKFTADRGTPYSATYLPEVALEQDWTQEEAVRSLVRKAGYHGSVTAHFIRQSGMTCTRYQSSKTRVAYSEYVRLRHNGLDPLN